MFPKLWHCLLFSVFLWNVRNIETYDDFCDEPHPSMYCSCDIKYRETTMACYVNANLTKDDEIWRDMSKVENVVILKLFARTPAVISELPTDSLKSMQFLETLIVQQGSLNELQSYALAGLKLLRELEMEGCEITALQAHSIADLPKLKRLSLSENSLKEVLADTFTGLLDLEKLFLDRNSISRIEGCAFCDLQNLRELDLWANEITDLTEYMFRGLRYLKHLDMSKNKIRILNDKIFHSMPKLEALDLHGNLIHHVAPRAFQGLLKLQRLYLHTNKIKMLPDIVFKSLPSLRSVDLYKNELETLQVQVLEHMNMIKDEHFSVDIKRNPLVCDCRLSWVTAYLKISKSRQFTGDLKQLNCTLKNESVTLLHKLEMNCSKSVEENHPKSMITTSRSVVIQPVDLVPYEIQKLKNKTVSKEEVAGDDVVISQDGESEVVEKTDENVESGPNGTRAISADFQLTVFVMLLTVFLVRKRKGTCFELI